MKRIYLLLSVLLISVMLIGQNEATQFTNDNPDGRPRDPRSDQFNFVQNEVLVKFKDNVTLNSGTQLKSAGINGVDQIIKNIGGASLEKLFPDETKLKSARIVKDPTGKDMVIPSLHNIYKIVLPQQKSTNSQPVDIFQFIEEMKVLPEVEYAEPNYIYTIGDFTPAGPEMSMLEAMEQPANEELLSNASGLIPNDPLYNQQWGIPATNIDDVWNTNTGDSTSIIAILDTGVDWLHPDLAANIWTNKGEIPNNGKDDDGNGLIDDIRGWDYINSDNNPTDDNSHGTHVAGIAAAVGNNGIGITGVNWKAKIMPIKVIQSSGKGDAATIAKGVNYAATQGATVINMSFGSYAESLTLKDALASAYANAVLVAAVGNDAIEIGPCLSCAPMYPGAYSSVLGVEANTNSELAGFSNYDKDGPVFSYYADLLNYELKAPGVDILSCVPGGNYREFNGTSMAAPLVAGAVSLYKKQNPNESQEIMFGSLINSLGQHIDLEKALNIIPVPKLDIVSYTVTDTLDGDGDGRPDVGETIEIKVNVRNTWGLANDVKVGIEFGEFEDPAVAQLLNREAMIGSVSAYATLSNNIPLKIKIDPNVVDNRAIVFILKTWYGNHLGEKAHQIILNVENGVELKGIISQNMTLFPNRHYIVTENLAIPKNVTLTIKPGTQLNFKNNSKIVSSGFISALGKPDSLIVFTSTNSIWRGIEMEILSLGGEFSYCNFSNCVNSNAILSYFGKGSYKIQNCIIKNCQGHIKGQYPQISRNLFTQNNSSLLFLSISPNNFEIKENIIVDNKVSKDLGAMNVPSGGPKLFIGNSIFSNINNFGDEENLRSSGNFEILTLDSGYWGTTNIDKINSINFDFSETGNGGWFDFSNLMNKPSLKVHGHVWKVLVNGKDAQDEFVQLDPIGVGKQKFDVYFNREMDTKYPPTISMGVRYPYTQTTIGEDGTWSADSSIYTVYGTIGLTTGDGINTIRVTGAKDIEHFEIPIEDRRFKVIVNAAGSASTEFIATPGIGKVNLEWASNDLEDGLGYNMYRMNQINDSTLGVPQMINSVLITDTSYTDSDVISNQKYFYYYKALRTNLTETDSSRMVAAIPLTASKGDANGDLLVNTMDITTIAAFVLNNNPQPFIFEAADMNSDLLVNILDIIKTANKVMSGGQEEVVSPNEKVVELYLKNDTLFADASVAIGGFQFDIFGVTSIDEIEKLNILDGFELGYSLTENTFRIILYSLTGKTIPVGNRIPLLKLKKGSGLTDIVLSDKNGSPINVTFNETGIWNLSDNLRNGVAELGQNFPNPFTGQTTIPVFINEPVDEATIHIINSMGQKIAVLLLKNPVLGKNLLQWNQGQQKGLMAYFLEIRRNGKQAVCGVKKMIVQ